MKRTFTFYFLAVALIVSSLTAKAQTSLAKWTMLGQSGPTVTPATSLAINNGKLISAVGQSQAAFVSSVSAPTDPVFICNGWNVGSGNAWFLINFSTTGHSSISINFVFETYQFGPKNFKTQYSTSSSAGPWTDFGSALNYGSTGGSGSYSFNLPAACNSQSNVWVRVVTTTAPTSTGGSYIDEVELLSSTPLDVNLGSFDGRIVPDGILLNWVINNEQGITDYEIERSVNGADFTSIKKINATGGEVYQFTDRDENKETSLYYRLRMNINGTSPKYSRIVRLNVSKLNGKPGVYPNPVSGNSLQVTLPKGLHSGTVLSIIDLNGKIVMTKEITNTDLERFIVMINTGSLDRGNYILQLSDPVSNESSAVAFIK